METPLVHHHELSLAKASQRHDLVPPLVYTCKRFNYEYIKKSFNHEQKRKEKKRKEKKGNLLTLHQSLLSAATGQMPKAYLRQCIPG